MLVIIEGADKTGKSTLAHAIEKRFGYSYRHFGAPGPDPGREYAEFLASLKEPTVCDRFYIGEQVYGPLLRGKAIITNLQKAVIERYCRFRGAVLIWACTPLEIVQERLVRDGDDLISLEQNAKAWNMFKSVISECNVLPLCCYDSSKPGALERIMCELDPVLNTMRHIAGMANYYCSGFGTIWGPRMVVVGDAINERVTWINKPFDRGSSSEYLYSCLREASIPEKRLYFCNAKDLTVEEATFLRIESSEPWLALGDKAHNRLSELGITHSYIPHPQFWKRFHVTQREEYVGMLRLWKKDYERDQVNFYYAIHYS